MSKWLRFDDITVTGRKTRYVDVRGVHRGDYLGSIKWFGRWRQYAFFPCHETIFNGECLMDIRSKLAELMDERRKAKR